MSIHAPLSTTSLYRNGDWELLRKKQFSKVVSGLIHTTYQIAHEYENVVLYCCTETAARRVLKAMGDVDDVEVEGTE